VHLSSLSTPAPPRRSASLPRWQALRRRARGKTPGHEGLGVTTFGASWLLLDRGPETPITIHDRPSRIETGRRGVQGKRLLQHGHHSGGRRSRGAARQVAGSTCVAARREPRPPIIQIPRFQKVVLPGGTSFNWLSASARTAMLKPQSSQSDAEATTFWCTSVRPCALCGESAFPIHLQPGVHTSTMRWFQNGSQYWTRPRVQCAGSEMSGTRGLVHYGQRLVLKTGFPRRDVEWVAVWTTDRCPLCLKPLQKPGFYRRARKPGF